MKRNPIELSDRLALTVEEAAAAIGVSKRHLHSKLSEVPHFYLGNRVVIPLKPFEEWLRDRAKAGKAQADQVTDEILRGLTVGSK
jgi:hypothetical protein